MEPTAKSFTTQHQASFAVVDPFGHMSTPHYLHYFLEHRWVALRDALGLDLATIGKLPFVFVMRRVQVEFERPIFCDEKFEIVSHVSRWDEADSFVECEMRKANGKVAARCHFAITCVAKETKQSIPYPAEFKQRFYEVAQ
jgi:acyl-CoA thioesterase FadM